METASQLAQSIADDIWLQIIHHHRDDDDCLVLKSNIYPDGSVNFTYIDWPEEAKPITEEDAKELILKTVIQRLNTEGKVILYTCTDNLLVTIEMMASYEDDDEWSVLQEIEGFNQHYYIGFD